MKDYITHLNTKLILVMCMIRSRLAEYQLRDSCKWQMIKEENLRSVRGVKSALSIMKRIKRETLTSNANRLDHLQKLKLSFQELMKTTLWWIKVSLILISETRVPSIIKNKLKIISLMMLSLHQARMAVEEVEMPPSMKWLCKVIFQCFNSSSKSSSHHSSQFNYLIKPFKIIWWVRSSCLTNLVTNKLVLIQKLALFIQLLINLLI